MATPVFCCGFECGLGPVNVLGHFRNIGSTAVAISTTTFRSGLRSLRANPSASDAIATCSWSAANELRHVGRVYVYFATALPDANTLLVFTGATGTPSGPAVFFKQSDSKIYAAVAAGVSGAATLGATGVTVTTGTWYRIDFHFLISTAGNDTCDVKVDGTDCGQATAAGSGSGVGDITIGVVGDQPDRTVSADVFFDDFLLSATALDYPLGAGYALSYIPNADGDGSSANRHYGLGANEVERTLTGTDITNTTTDAYTLVDERPLPTTEVDFINWKTNGTAGDYVEIAYEDSVESVAPRTVEAIAAHHDAGGAGTNAWALTLRESGGGTTGDIFNSTTNVGATITYKRAHFATVPGTSNAWTTANFNALRSRFIATDASPDVYLDALMLEAEYAEVAAAGFVRSLISRQAVKRAAFY